MCLTTTFLTIDLGSQLTKHATRKHLETLAVSLPLILSLSAG